MSESTTVSSLAAKTYRVNEVVSCVDEGEDGAMLYNPDKDDTVLLNPSGRAIWAFIAVRRTIDDIAGYLMTVYPGVAREQAAHDADEFIQSLLPNFVLVGSESADAG